MKLQKPFILVSLVQLVLFAQFANAGLLVEPILGYESGSVKCTAVSSLVCDHNTTGVNFGARLGWQFSKPFWVALDYNSASPTAKYNSSGVADDKVTRTVSGVAIGYEPSNFRFWLSYGSSAEAKYVDSATPPTTTDRSLKSGTATKAGIGYKLHRLISLNLEYSIENYAKYEQDSLTVERELLFPTYTPSRMIFSVSFPWNMGGK